jgi:hypothetical protein
MAISNELRRRIEALAGQLCDEAGEVDESQGDCWLDAAENQALELSDALHAAVVARRAAQQSSEDAESICPECGRRGCCRGIRKRALITRRGPTTIVEPECYCPSCRRAFFPDDRRAGR